MRGLQRSRTVESLVAEARMLEAQGVQELVLISQDTTRYGEDIGLGRTGLATLVAGLLAETSFPWIRFLYAYPKTLHPSVLELMARESRFVPYVDIPLQHVSRPVLAAMRRGGDPASYRRMITSMRETVPGIAIRTTFIVGFPGETGEDFASLESFVSDMELENVGVFTYSPEPGSGAEPLGDPVPAELKEERRARVMEIQQTVARRKGRALRGRILDALIEGPCTDTDLLLEGRVASQAPEIDGRVLINDIAEGLTPPVGRIARVKITGAHDYDLVGRIVGV